MTAAITHQDIIDRIEELGREHGAAYKAERARQDKELASLQELCGGIGHFFAKERGGLLLQTGRFCVFCNKREAAHAA